MVAWALVTQCQCTQFGSSRSKTLLFTKNAFPQLSGCRVASMEQAYTKSVGVHAFVRICGWSKGTIILTCQVCMQCIFAWKSKALGK